MFTKKTLNFINNSRFSVETITFISSYLFLFLFNLVFPDMERNNEKYFLLLVLVIIFGLPHGALDSVVARKRSVYKSFFGFFIFNLIYISLVIITFLLWKSYSLVMLIFFLLISIHHFSEDWQTNTNYFDRIMFSSGLILFPSLFFSNDVTNIYFLLTKDSRVSDFVNIQKFVAYILLLFYLFFFYKYFKYYNYLTQFIIIILSSFTLNPIDFFISYFCFFHSIKNYKEVIKDTNSSILSKSVIINILVSLAIGYLFYIHFLNGNTDEKLLRIVFIGLAALTVPHMFLKIYITKKDSLFFQKPRH